MTLTPNPDQVALHAAAHNPPRPFETLTTPCLLLDGERLDRNLSLADAIPAPPGLVLRPHLKTAKSIEVALRATTPTGGPITVSTLHEAEVFAAAGFTDITYAVSLAPGKLDRARAIAAQGVRLSVLLETEQQAETLVRTDAPGLNALIEIDCDGRRGGIPASETAHLLRIARILDDAGRMAGVLTHSSESYDRPGKAAFAEASRREIGAAVAAAETLRSAGLSCQVVSVGSTPTALYGADFDGVSEIRAGVFMFFDLMQAGIGACSLEDIALSVLTTVIGHRQDGSVIVDAGWMAMSRDRGTAAQEVDMGYGLVCDAGGQPLGELILKETSQEHGIVAPRGDGGESEGGGAVPGMPVGTLLRILPNHACATAAQHAGYHLVLSGEEQTTAWWPRFGGW